MADAPPLLRLRGITKAYPAVLANDAVDLDVGTGEIHAVLGENGAGKSTLMKIIYGSVRPDAGTVEWNGSQVDIQSPAMARELGIGMVFQHFSLFETLTAAENISLAVSGTIPELSRRIREASARFGLDVEPDARVQSMTVGERQRIEILRCILQEPRLIIMDEPTSVLPPQGIAKLFETLRKLASEGIGIIFISHKLEEIRALCDTATIMRGGRVVGVCDPREEDARSLTRLMIGREIARPRHGAERGDGHPVLEVTGLNHTPENPFATPLRDVHLTLRSGEILGIAGVSGNGQDSLTQALAGEIETPDDRGSTVMLEGKAIGALGPYARRKLGLHFIPEERLGRGAVPIHTLSENSGLTTYHRGMVNWGFLNLGRRRKLAAETIERMDVRCGGTESTAQSLSGGNLQKFIVGRELALAPRVLIVSQPTWGVDVGAAAAIRQQLIDLRDSGAALLVVSEELEELLEICDRIQVMFRGRLSGSVPVRDTDMDHLGLAMAGDFDALNSSQTMKEPALG
ncbi:ABC transporter ATP-binding protein [Ponticoccus sp. SC2-23]|uniref:ABC transporter ATP-binding protein n=1 Tax=Alexandriicola marinus TaxID=2081710 RepID=UPI00193C8056|nr:ABC transporter ATP-binding protein [Alexandriicola marinus]MBM1221294.1 ABC transporter ATP-binding protein [Ponticoccus sp. SC6-9]MBM1225864.1 ABC transporter ATP-binding protein [Ponticoccus sp. SC6-15]MBM1228016.1 ABC transporter ATP-binding protein [Ponticoccus sp. SC6-38]MBM1234346.1 ABC transporter ATP-binding protein [Ponticoccus sp. SC6-45]MBM1238518.1 ABC transporter ATP-binding protein [Ponticoccus sp. SC6-49]MBM1243787.1 ABC transporter ATP-binding protein [Ponticoccus sp. SC2-